MCVGHKQKWEKNEVYMQMWTLGNILVSENTLKNYNIERGMIGQQINSCTSECAVACQVSYPKLMAMNSSKLL